MDNPTTPVAVMEKNVDIINDSKERQPTRMIAMDESSCISMYESWYLRYRTATTSAVTPIIDNNNNNNNTNSSINDPHSLMHHHPKQQQQQFKQILLQMEYQAMVHMMKEMYTRTGSSTSHCHNNNIKILLQQYQNLFVANNNNDATNNDCSTNTDTVATATTTVNSDNNNNTSDTQHSNIHHHDQQLVSSMWKQYNNDTNRCSTNTKKNIDHFFQMYPNCRRRRDSTSRTSTTNNTNYNATNNSINRSKTFTTGTTNRFVASSDDNNYDYNNSNMENDLDQNDITFLGTTTTKAKRSKKKNQQQQIDDIPTSSSTTTLQEYHVDQQRTKQKTTKKRNNSITEQNNTMMVDEYQMQIQHPYTSTKTSTTNPFQTALEIQHNHNLLYGNNDNYHDYDDDDNDEEIITWQPQQQRQQQLGTILHSISASNNNDTNNPYHVTQVQAQPPPLPPPVPMIRESLKRKFQPPSIKENRNQKKQSQQQMISSTSGTTNTISNTNSDMNDDDLPDELRMYDRDLIEKIENEIMESNTNNTNDHHRITFNDIAGLQQQKQTVYEVVCWPMQRPDLFTGLRRAPNGLLLYGPPGTGKTLIGKAIAHESGATFFSISSSSLTSKWIGEGEKLVRVLFAVAAYRQPAVVFIDEIDSLLSQRKSDENEASRRMKTEFLIQLDGTGTSGQGRVLVIGATNRPHELDEAARRRFTKRLYIPLPELADREILIRVLLKTNEHLLTDSDIHKLAIETEGFSGADLKALSTDAAMGPIRQLGTKALEVNIADVPPISYRHFRQALKGMKPSVSPDDLIHYIEWDKTFGTKRAEPNDDSDSENEESVVLVSIPEQSESKPS